MHVVLTTAVWQGCMFLVADMLLAPAVGNADLGRQGGKAEHAALLVLHRHGAGQRIGAGAHRRCQRRSIELRHALRVG